jgi:hypothetical protein
MESGIAGESGDAIAPSPENRRKSLIALNAAFD